MARIPEHEVERLKSEVSLARLVESLGIVLTRHGETYWAYVRSMRIMNPRWS